MDGELVRVGIDWLTMTKAWQNGRPEQTAENTVKYLMGDKVVMSEKRPFPRSYSHAIGTEHITASWHPEHERMKVCMNMTGQNCHEFYLSDGNMRKLIIDTWIDDMNVTRVDFALDYFGEASIIALVEQIMKNPSCTVAHKLTPYRQIEMSDGNVKEFDSGVYIGSQKSDRYICVYNKALEQGIDGKNWTRIELRNRRTMAGQMVDMITKDDIGSVGKQLIRDYAMPDVDWWHEALTGPHLEVPVIGRKETDTRRWLIEVVAPVLQAELARVDGYNDPLYKKFKSVIDNATLSLFGGRPKPWQVDT